MKYIFCLFFPLSLFAQTISLKQGDSASFYLANKSVVQGKVVHLFQNAQHKTIGAYLKSEAEANTIQLQLFRENGALRWAKSLPHQPDAHFPSVALHESGFVVTGNPETGDVTFWNDTPEPLKRISLFGNDKVSFDLEKSLHLAFHPNGDKIVVAAMREVASENAASDNAQVFVFTKFGDLVWQQNLPRKAISKLQLSENGNTFQIQLYEERGNNILTENLILDWQGNHLSNQKSSFLNTYIPQNTYPYPLKPFDQTHVVTGSFGEYRGPSSAHFHNGTDLPDVDGTNVYAVADAVVSGISTTGVNAYLRAGNHVYVHIVPNPNLPVGATVKQGETVIGTILSGQGHVHFSEGPAGSYVNAIRTNGGFTPFIDTWKPTISNVQFSHFETGNTFLANALAGNVKITMRVKDPIGAPNNSEATQNNGAYIVGYDIRKRDRTTVVFSPSLDAVTHRLDVLPSDTNVHFVYDQTQSSNSWHQYIVTNKTTANSVWNTTVLADGDYTVRLFAQDSRGNEDAVFVDVSITQRDLVPPAQPILLTAQQKTGAPSFEWTQNAVSDLVGFRLFQSTSASSWQNYQSESVLNANSRTFTSLLSLTSPTYFYLASLDNANPPNLSLQSDVYGIVPFIRNKKLLIVDGFDRWTGSASWKKPFHDFAYLHGRSIAASGYGFETCANEALISGKVKLGDYDVVIWLLGDESTTDETFSDAEQALVKAYLENGGRLFVSGSEIAWDLGAKGSASDIAFLRDYLKAQYAGDSAEFYQAEGAINGVFAQMRFDYGSSPYPEDFPDYITATNGGSIALNYSNGRGAAVQFSGNFGNGTKAGKLLYLAFPFETITNEATQQELMQKSLRFLLDEVASPNDEGEPQMRFTLHQNYPNPFSTQTHFSFDLPKSAHIKATIYDVLGRKVATLLDAPLPLGTQQLSWQPEAQLANGVYFLQLETQGTIARISVVLAR